MKKSLEFGARSADVAGVFQGTAHLAGDFTFADDDGFQTRGDRKEVLGDRVSMREVHGFSQVLGAGSGEAGQRFEDGIECGNRRNPLIFIEIDIGLKAVAGRDNYSPGDGGVRREHELGQEIFVHGRQNLENVKRRVFVIGREAEEHGRNDTPRFWELSLSIVPGPLNPAPSQAGKAEWEA